MYFKKRRVVVTGMGVVAPNGKNKDEYWESLLHGRSGVRKISLFDVSEFQTQIGGEISDFNPEDYGIDKKESKRMGRFSKFALAAAKMAVVDAGIFIDEEMQEKIGVVMGVSVNGVEIIEREAETLRTKGVKMMNPFGVPGALPNAAASHIAIEFGIKGKVSTISTGCSSTLNAIGYAHELIKYGKTDMIICGGSESPLTPSVLGSFCASNSLSKRNEEPEKASRPFDKNRDGYVLCEGAAIFVLESLESAIRRDAEIYAEIIGYGDTSDAFSMYKIEESGNQAARAMAMCMNDADIDLCEVDYINAHGSSSYISDIRETVAIKKVFGDYAGKIPVSSVKSMIGHGLGVAGGFQTAATLLAGKNGYIPATINYEHEDPNCDLDYVPNEAIRKRINVAMVNSFGMGGNNASLLFRMF